MWWCVDIDGTIAYRNMHVFLRLCRNLVDVGEVEVASYRDFLALPQIMEYQNRIGARRFSYEMRWLDLHPDSLRHAEIVRGAVEGLHLLSTTGEIWYYTARSCTSPEISQAMAEATREWLLKNHFPSPHQVVFCASPKDKLVRLAELAAAHRTSMALIDDKHARLLQACEELAVEQPEQFTLLQEFLTLIAFPAWQGDKNAIHIQTEGLPSWRYIERLVPYEVRQKAGA